MRRFVALTLLLLPAACRQVDELPAATANDAAAVSPAKAAPEGRPPAWLGSEASVFEHVQKTLEDAGFPEVRTAVFKVSEDVPLPYYRHAERTLYIPPFTDGQDAMRARVARMSARHFSGAFTFVDAFGSGEEAYSAYKAFLTIAVAHELSHHVQLVRRGESAPGPEEFYDIESEAIEIEQAFLAHEIEAKHVPAVWREHYRRSVTAIRDSIPDAAFTALPEDDKALRRAFAQAYLEYGRGEANAANDGVNVEISAASLVFAGYTQRRLTLLAKGGRSLEALAKAQTASKGK